MGMTNPANIMVFDRSVRKQRAYRRDLAAYGFLHEWAEQNLQDRLQDIKRSFQNGLTCTPSGASCNGTPLDIDEEFWPFERASLDLISSNLVLHSVNDLPGTLLQIKQSLKPDGLFIASMFGGETLRELRESLTTAELNIKGGVSPRVFPFADKQQMGALLQRAGFALPVVDSEILTVTYDNMFKLMHDLRYMGENNIIQAREKTNPGKAFFMDAARHYHEHFSDPDGRIRASFEIIFLIGWAPHESQQKPLRPGSAEQRLADVLGTTECGTTEQEKTKKVHPS